MRTHPAFVHYVSFVKSWCCSARAIRLGGELRCKCGTLLFEDHYNWHQRYLVEGDDLHPLPRYRDIEENAP